MRVSAAILVALATLFIGLSAGYLVGQRKGVKQGVAAGAFERAKIECVYLTLSFRDEENGDDVDARDLRYRLLYGAAQELDAIASSGSCLLYTSPSPRDRG